MFEKSRLERQDMREDLSCTKTGTHFSEKCHYCLCSMISVWEIINNLAVDSVVPISCDNKLYS